MQIILDKEWKTLPEQAQLEVYNYFLFIKQQYILKAKGEKKQKNIANKSDVISDEYDTILFSNHSANLVEDWKNDKEDDVWK